MPGRAVSQARLALLVLLALLGTPGCALLSQSIPDASPPVAEARPSALVLGELREPHAEPELVSVRHVVAGGETLYRIARTYGITVTALSEANGIEDPRSLVVGQELVIPSADLVVPVATGSPPSSPPSKERPGTDARPSPSSGKPVAAAPSRPGARPAKERPVPETKGTLDWPLRGVLYARFGKKGREPHDGIDLAVPAGTPVKAAQEGEVLYAGEQRGYGLIVIVQHSDRLITLYAHNRDLRVRTGQKVDRKSTRLNSSHSGESRMPSSA